MSKTVQLRKLILLAVLLVGRMIVLGQNCAIPGYSVQLNSVTSVGGNCIVNFDFTWDQDANAGNKWTNVHFWLAANYPTLPYTNPPTAVQLSNALGTVVLADPTTTPTLSPTYPPDPTAKILNVTGGIFKETISGHTFRFTLKGVEVTVPGACTGTTSIKADIWSSNSSQDQVLQCIFRGASFIVGEPAISGTVACNNPRALTFTLTTSFSTPIGATAYVYVDLPPFGILDPGDPLIATITNITIPPLPGSFVSSPVNIPNIYSGNNVWVRVMETGEPFSSFKLITNPCGVLPIELLSFSATRGGKNETVLNWETASEQNNKGFAVQRKELNSDFVTIGFVPSKATNGNSSVKLSYQYTDSYSGESLQYRLVQTDLNGKETNSPIVSVKNGPASTDARMYPNPAIGGRTAVYFDKVSPRSLYLIDSKGAVLTTKENVADNKYEFSNLRTGVYVIKIVDATTGQTQVIRLVVP